MYYIKNKLIIMSTELEQSQVEGMFDRFYNNLKVLREFKRLTQREASKQINLRNSSRYETLESGRGVPTLIEVLDISKYYKCSVEDLIYKKANMPILEFKD